jgi:DNA-binding PucR family transcriptional regulator
MAMTATVSARVAQIAELQLRRADELADAIGTAILESAPVLSEDPALIAEMRASNRANVHRFLSQQIAHPGQQPPSDIPPEALDLARSMVRRGVDLGVLSNAYRQGQNVAWQQWMQTVIQAAPADELPELLTASSSLLFAFVDGILTGLITQIEREREALLGGELARREQTLRLLLDGAPLDRIAASATLGYELNRLHTAFIAWGEPATARASDLEAAATTLAQAAGVVRPLRFSASASTLWGWLGTDHELDVDELLAAGEALPSGIRAAAGATRRGTSGFRQSHDDAIAVQRLLTAGPATERFAAYREVEVITLLAADEQRMREFITDTLGPLAESGPARARLRETVRIYLQEADNSAAAAARLNTHRNTILHRIARAQELLGAPLASRRLALLVALEAAHRLGLPSRPESRAASDD